MNENVKTLTPYRLSGPEQRAAYEARNSRDDLGCMLTGAKDRCLRAWVRARKEGNHGRIQSARTLRRWLRAEILRLVAGGEPCWRTVAALCARAGRFGT